MDLNLRALCVEVLNENVSSEEFATLLIETGVNIESYEWDIANKLLEKQEFMLYLSKRFGQSVH